MNEEIMTIKNFSAQDETAEVIKNNLVKLAKYAMNNDSRYKRVAELSFSNEKIDNYEELNLKEIGEIIGVTESRASQIRSRALIRLKTYLKNIS